MKYIEYINEIVRKEVASHDQLIVFGQNINAGSRLGGFTKNLAVTGKSKIINTTNSENALVGFGFGIMIDGGSAIFFMKQLDFLLLGIDHLVNTYNIVRNHGEYKGSFTIMPVIIDNGFQGPHSSANNFADFCSIARLPGFTITNKADADAILPAEMVKPGFRIIGISQRLFKEETIIPSGPLFVNKDRTVFQYEQGKDVTVVAFNFSFPQAVQLVEGLRQKDMSASLFNVNSPTPAHWENILEDIKITGKLVLIDDSKSENLACNALVADATTSSVSLKKTVIIKRELGMDWLRPVSDEMKIDVERVYNALE
jgi:pyruvate/2-oxoglutarate/acetoin dehydrogenase E1 component